MSGSGRPNILLLFTDQQRFDTVNACGYPHMQTPNLDRLCREGARFERAYTPNPVCIPARHNVLTGLPARFHGYAANFGHPLDHRLPTLPRLLADNGYDTRAIGKMHFRPPRRHSGFAKMELMEEIPRFREDDDYAMYLKDVGFGHIQNIHGVRNLLYMVPQRSLIPEEHHGSTWVGDRSVEYIRSNGGKRPFFLWCGWIAPHPPFDVPDTFADLYADAELPEPHVSETPLSPAAEAHWRYADLPEGKESEHVRRMRELYYAAISQVDKNVGKILAALEEIGELDNTLIIYASDHGELLGDYGCFQKMQAYDSCSRIPFLVRYPARLKPGTVRADFVDLNDILPTILDVAGVDYPGPNELPGASIFGNSKDRTTQYIEYGKDKHRWIALRDDRYKYVYHYAGAYEQLFDLLEDPTESVDLLHGSSAPTPAISAVRDQLRAALLAHEQKWGLEEHTTENAFVPFDEFDRPAGRNGQFPVFPENIADPAEHEAMNSFGDEVLQAVRDEALVKLHELDLDGWEANGAPDDVIKQIRREGL